MFAKFCDIITDITIAALFLLYSTGGDVLALCHDKQASDAHQARPFNSPNGQGLTQIYTSVRVEWNQAYLNVVRLSDYSVEEPEPNVKNVSFAILCVFYCTYTVSQKKGPLYFCPQLWQMLTDFRNFSIVEFTKKFATN